MVKTKKAVNYRKFTPLKSPQIWHGCEKHCPTCEFSIFTWFKYNGLESNKFKCSLLAPRNFRRVTVGANHVCDKWQ